MNALINRSRLFDELFRDIPSGFFVRPLHGDPLPAPGQVRIDVQDTGAAYVVKADLLGVRKEDIHVNVEGALVTLSAEVQQEDQQSQEGKVIHTERYSGSMSRSFSLPAEVDSTQAKARHDHGVLTLTLP